MVIDNIPLRAMETANSEEGRFFLRNFHLISPRGPKEETSKLLPVIFSFLSPSCKVEKKYYLPRLHLDRHVQVAGQVWTDLYFLIMHFLVLYPFHPCGGVHQYRFRFGSQAKMLKTHIIVDFQNCMIL